ncbi:hypothetical protein JHK86_038075 [Glycine max]|nr:hypothetical protein JHK86_038075 [Glycine max]
MWYSGVINMYCVRGMYQFLLFCNAGIRRSDAYYCHLHVCTPRKSVHIGVGNGLVRA